MRVTVCLLLVAACACALADKNGSTNRRTKPFVADAVGNTLPPPSNVPATVGSPISLLTPDKYEFYTFDESGELVKRLMTLEEIQAIVAAGEDSEGLVTFANENQPTIAFNFSQPPYTKVHSVVTNVQNVLKAQMEAHKNKPLVQPTLDTPDVSDSWSLILPSIFGNSGADIVPEKPTSSFIPETETIEEVFNVDDGENTLSKEGSSQISSSAAEIENQNEIKTTPSEVVKTTLASSTSTTTTTKPTTTTKVTTTAKPIRVTTIRNKLITTTRPRTTTTQTPITSKLPPTTKITTTTTTVKPTTTTRTTSAKPITTTYQTKKQTTTPSSTSTTKEYISNDIPTAKPVTEYEKISTFIPISTVKYVTERITTQKPTEFTKAPFVYAPTTKRSPSTTTKSPQDLSSTELPKKQTTVRMPTSTTNKIYVTSASKDSDLERINLTTITTQSVSPSTTVSSTEFLLVDNSQSNFEDNSMRDDDPIIPLFDVAQSISQIASDLGNNYQPIPTSSNLLDTTKVNSMEMESKEDLDMDIPNDDLNKNKGEDNFVKISTIDPHPKQNNSESNIEKKEQPTKANITEKDEISTTESYPSEGTTIDPILSESMGDLLSQIVHEAPEPISNSDNLETDNNKDLGAEQSLEATTTELSRNISEITTPKNIVFTTQKMLVETETKDNTVPEKETFIPITTDKETLVSATGHKETPVATTTEEEPPVKLTDEKEIPIEVTTDKEILFKNDIEKKTPVTAMNEKLEPAKITTSKPALLSTKNDQEKVTNKITTETVSKTSTEDTINGKDDDSKDFVKISVSSTTNSSANESNKQENEGGKGTEKNDSDSNKITSPQKQDGINNQKEMVVEQKIKKPTLEVVTTSPNVELTTKVVKISDVKNKTVTGSLSNTNKNSTEDKLSENSQKEIINDPFPKVDEFKKKIQKVNDEEMANDRNDPWRLVPTVIPPKGNSISKDKVKINTPSNPSGDENKNVVLEFSKENQGLQVTTKDLGEDVAQFTELCNELAFRYWNKMAEKFDKKRSFVLSPYSITSMLAMMFMGAKGATSGEMNEILKLDDMVTFNPHFTLKNISDSIEQATDSGISVSAFIRELFSDRNKGKILTFYKERAQHFYSGHVEEINFKLISDIIRRRTNLLVKKHTWGKIPEYMKTNSIVMNPPLAAFSTNIFETDCTGTTVDGRDGEMYFVVSPNVRQRRLVPVPAVVYKSGFLAGYDPVLDATAAALGNTNSIVSTIFLMPGQQGNIVHGDDLEKLEQRLLEAEPTTPVWNRVLRTLLPRVGLELQIPRFSHKSVFNVSSTLREMGLKDLFDADHADLGGLNGPSKDLYLSDMIQVTSFATCGEGMIGEQHHVEEYPETLSVARRRTSRWADWDEPRDYQRAFHDPHDVGEAMHLPLHLRPRQARLPTRSVQSARLKFDRPFLFFVRHNPSGMILYVGRYNPRLLP